MAGAKLEKTRYPASTTRAAGTSSTGPTPAASGIVAPRTPSTTPARARPSASAKPATARLPSPPGRLTLARYARELFGSELDRPDDREPMRGRYIGRRRAVRDRTREQYRVYVERFWLPELATRPLDSLTAADLRRVIDRLEAREGKDYLADVSIRRLIALMSAFVATAAEECLCRATSLET